MSRIDGQQSEKVHLVIYMSQPGHWCSALSRCNTSLRHDPQRLLANHCTQGHGLPTSATRCNAPHVVNARTDEGEDKERLATGGTRAVMDSAM